MNQARAAEANKHRLAVARALLAKDGLVKHVLYQGKSILYVCLPALHEEFLNSHSVYIPSYTSFVKSLDHPLALKDRPYSHRFHPQATKTAALAFRWSSKRDSLPTVEELADLLHLDESTGHAGLKSAAAGVPAGLQPPPVVMPEAAANCETATPSIPADPQVSIPHNAPPAINPLFQVLPKGVGLTWGRRSKAALQMRQQLWEHKQQQQRQQAVSTSWASSESPQQSIEEPTVKEQPALAAAAELQQDVKQLATAKLHKPSARIPSYMVLRHDLGQQLQGQRLNARGIHKQEARLTAAAVASVVGDAAAGIAAGAAEAAQEQGRSGDPAKGGNVAVRNISNGGAGGNSGGSSSNQGSQGVGPSDGQAAAAASNANAAAAGNAAAGAAASSNDAAPSNAATTTAAIDGDKERRTPQQERNLVANSRTGSSSNLLAGQQQHQQTISRKRSSSQEALKQQQQQDTILDGRKKQRTTPPLASLGASSAVAAAAAAAAAYHLHQQQQQGNKPSIRRLPVGMQVADMQQQQWQQQQQQQQWQQQQQQQWQQAHGHQQQQGVSCAAPMGSQQVMQQQLKHMLGTNPDFMNPTPHLSFISVGCQQQQQSKAAENSNGATPKQQTQQRHLAWQTEQAPQQQQQQYLPGHILKPKVLPLPVAMQIGRKTEQQRQQLQVAFRQAWQQHQQQQHTGQHWQQLKPSNLKPRFADLNDVVRAAGHAQGGNGVARQQQAAGPTGQPGVLLGQADVYPAGQPGVQLSGPAGADHLGQAGAHVSGQAESPVPGQPGIRLSGPPGAHVSGTAGTNHSGQAGAHVSGQPGSRSAGQAAEAAGKFSMKAVFSGRQMKRLQQLLKQQHDEDEGVAQLQQQEQPSTDWQQQDYQQGFGAQLQQYQQQQVFSTPVSALVQEESEAQQVPGHAAAQQNHSSSLPLKRKPLETGSHLLGSTAVVPAAAAAVGISACDHALLLPPPQRRKRVSSDAGLMSKPHPGVEYTLNPDELQEVTSLLLAVCVMVGAVSLQHLVAAIDQLLLPGMGASDVPRQAGRDQAANKQQQQSAADLPSRSAAAAAAGGGSARQSAVPTGVSEKGGTSKELLSAVRWLAAKLGSVQQQQELVIPTLQQLCQVHPCLLDTVSTLDGKRLLSVTEEQLQAFLAGILAVELQHSMQRLGIKAVQNSANELHTHELGTHQQQKLVVQQQQQQVAGASNDNKVGGGGAGNALIQPPQKQQQQQVLTGVPSTGEGHGSSANALLQQQQQFAMALMSEYKSGGQVVCCKPKTLMILAAHRMMAAVAHETVQQQEGTVGLMSPAAQAAAAAAVAARLAERELQLAAARSGSGSSQQLLGGGFRGGDNSTVAAGNPKRATAGNSSSSATTAAAGDEQPASLSSSSISSNAGLHILNALLLRSQFHPELHTGMLSGDMPNRCAVAAAAAGTTSDLKVSSAATLVFGFSLQGPQGLQSVGHAQGLGDARCLNPAEPAPEAVPKPLADQVLATWLCVGPDVVLWRKLVTLLLQFQQQQEEEGKETPSHAQQQYDLQQCYTKAQEVLHNLQLQPDDLVHIHTQLKRCTPSTSQQQQQQQHVSGVVLQQQTWGRGVLLPPGWLHLQVNHEPNVTLWFDVLRACDAAAAAVVQRDMPWVHTPELQGVAVQVGPLVLKTLQKWHAYCQQQQ